MRCFSENVRAAVFAAIGAGDSPPAQLVDRPHQLLDVYAHGNDAARLHRSSARSPALATTTPSTASEPSAIPRPGGRRWLS